MFVIFDVIFTVYFILYLPVLFLRGKWPAGFLERFGFIPPETVRALAVRENIWVHAVSVGEVAALEGVIRGLQERFPARQVVLTVTTRTGYSFARSKYDPQVMVLWSPLDLSITVDSFVRAIRPVVYVAAETELWPNLFARLAADKIPILVLNGRISDQAFPRYCWVRGLLRRTIERVNIFGMQSDLDAERIISLGAAKENVQVMGNVKFDNLPAQAGLDPGLKGAGPGQLVLLGGSTHPGEDELLLAVFLAERKLFPDLRLILVPRHPERALVIQELVRQAGLIPVLFSEHSGLPGADEVLVVDRIGQLLRLYSLATVVFVGKSLTAQGGHNIIEPAMFAKPVITGVNMQNFRDITKAFLAGEAVWQVVDAPGLQDAVHRLLADPDLRLNMGLRAQQVIRRNNGATRRAVDLVAGMIKGR
ncbi:MAG: 3-deoxy-D-manno-octulosonic acid transferase [Candidatus Omnitrophica bacterium]|nr:3-deoxy-D-manno-octulosonic acid transferase [Candidatus Omnitrophota bacterium]